MSTTTKKVTFTSQINEHFIDREEAATVILEALIAKAHFCMYGPPGTGKTALARFVCKMLSLPNSQGDSMSWALFQLCPFTKPEALHGPLDVPKYTKTGEYSYKTAGYMPELDVVILDELFKTTPATMHSQLGMLQERIFRNGSVEMKLPLRTAIAISNELAPSEAKALQDRFTANIWIDYVSNKKDFRAVMQQEGDPADKAIPCMSLEMLDKFSKAADQVVIPDQVWEVMDRIWECTLAGVDANGAKVDGLNGGPEYHGGNYSDANRPSDRRFKQAARLVKARAVCNKRSEAKPSDLLAMLPCLWVKPEQRHGVQLILMSCLCPSWPSLKAQANGMIDQINTYKATPSNTDGGHWSNLGRGAIDTIKSIQQSVDLPEAEAIMTELDALRVHCGEQAKHYLALS